MRIVSPEFGRIDRNRLPAGALPRLRRLDDPSASGGEAIFDWHDNRWLRVQNYVGVIQIPGLTIEILPKVSGPDAALFDPTPDQRESHGWGRAQRNLLYMLTVAGYLPFEDRELANLQTHRLPLIEALIAAFARRLQRELRRGLDRAYVRREENLSVVRGKILTSINAKLNPVRRDRLFVSYEDFVADTPINRVLKATSLRLLVMSGMPGTQQRLRECLIDLADVEEEVLSREAFGKIHYTRNSERFSPLLDFCRMVMLGTPPVPGAGEAKTFSLLFPMEQLFEAFIGRLIRRNARALGIEPRQVILQARQHTRWLVYENDARPRFMLKPDILFRGMKKTTNLIVDTKWKRLSGGENTKNNVAQADMYQLFAYAHRFECADNVLLYPGHPEGVRKRYHIRSPEGQRLFRVETVNLFRDLVADQRAMLGELKQILLPDVPDTVVK